MRNPLSNRKMFEISKKRWMKEEEKLYEDESIVIYIRKNKNGITDLFTIAKSNNCLFLEGFDHVFTPYGEL